MPSHPLVIAYHLIWTLYGWWLPNDPRGSGSHLVRCDVLEDLGVLHHGRKRAQPAGHVVRDFYERAGDLIKHRLLKLDAAAARVVGEAFGDVNRDQRYTCWACSIMPDHVHLVIRKHRDLAEDMIEKLKLLSRERLLACGAFPENHPVWAGGVGWKVFLDHPDEVWRTIPYVEKNPDPLGLPRQAWPFVVPYDNWPLHEGHSPNSPYAKALRAVGRYPR